MHVASGQRDYSGRYCYIFDYFVESVLAINGIDTTSLKLTHLEQRQCQHLHVIYQFKTLSREWAGAINKLVRNFGTSLWKPRIHIKKKKKEMKSTLFAVACSVL